MPEFTLDELKGFMLRCSGVPDDVSLDSDITDVAFADLGYDSLAVLEIASAIQRAYRVDVSDEAIEGMRTPGDVIDFVNSARTAAV